MAYRLDASEHLGDALLRVATEQLDDALGALGDGDQATPEGVHAARKSLKKTRALVRLARPALGPDAHRAVNAELREAGRLLSGTRDADVMILTARTLAGRSEGQVPADTFAMLLDALHEHAAAERGGVTGADATSRARAAIADLRAGTAHWPLERARRRTLVAGLRRSYERGRERFGAVRDDPGDAEASHDWRKRVKDLWYQQRLVAPAWPAVLGAQAEEAHVLSELLGDEHDLAVLGEHLAAGTLPVAGDLDPVCALIDRRRAELSAAALRLGSRLYAELPEQFAARTGAYLSAWRGEARATGIEVP